MERFLRINKREGKYFNMKELNLHEEIIKSLKLISYDRSLTLNEQGFGGSAGIIGVPQYVPLDPEEKKRRDLEKKFSQEVERQEKILSFKCKSRLKTKSSDPNENVAKKVFLELEDEIGHHWYDVSSWLTSKTDILNALKLIKNQQTYDKILELIDICYPDSAGMTIIELIQTEEFSPGQLGLKSSYRTPLSNMGPGGSIPEYLSWELNDSWLESYEKILKRFNPNEKYYQENPFLDEKGKKETNELKVFWRTQMPPFARSVFHNLTMLASLAVTVFSGGATAPLLIAFGIDLADATAYYLEGDLWTAGFMLVMSLVPLAGVTKTQIKEAALWYRSLKAMTPAARNSELSISPFKKIFDAATRTRNILKANWALFRMEIKNLIKELDPPMLVKLIFWLVKKAYLPLKFLVNAGLMLFGTYYTWSQIAIKLGIQQNESVKALNDMQITDIIRYYFDSIKSTTIRSVRDANNYNFDVYLLQLVLIHMGFGSNKNASAPTFNFKNGILTINNSNKVKGFKIYDAFGKLMESIDNKNKNNVLKSKKITYNGVLILYVTDLNGTTHKVKLFNGTNGSIYNSPTELLPNWGHFDKITETMLKEYQLKNNLSADGVFGSKVMQSVINKIDKKELTRIKNIIGQKIDKKEISFLMSKNQNNDNGEFYSEIGKNRGQINQELDKYLGNIDSTKIVIEPINMEKIKSDLKK